MTPNTDILKGIHPGKFLQHELAKRHIRNGRFALSIGEHPQTLSAILRGRRAMNTPLSLRIEKALGWEEGLLMTLQIFYEIAQLKAEQNNETPDLTKFRPVLFWDTTFDRINWSQHARYVINRVLERGNEIEILELIRFYGCNRIIELADIEPSSPFAQAKIDNLKHYLQYER